MYRVTFTSNLLAQKITKLYSHYFMSTTANHFLEGCLSCTNQPTHQFSSLSVIRERMSALYVIQSQCADNTGVSHFLIIHRSIQFLQDVS